VTPGVMDSPSGYRPARDGSKPKADVATNIWSPGTIKFTMSADTPMDETR
jgi:hypothetical protein